MHVGAHRNAQHPQQVVEVDPAHPLRAASHRAAETHSKRRQQLGERPAPGTQDDAEAHVHHADARLARGIRGAFPRLAHVGEVAVAARAGLVDLLRRRA
ncbi:MAG: hypothetical protein ACKOHI_05940, partial [Phycisphaerales bacterium]